MLIGPPLIQLMVFGYAATFDLNHVPIAIYDQDRSQASRDLVARFSGSPTFTVVATLDSGQPIDALIDSRQVQMVLVIDRRFTRDLLTHQPAPVQLILDGRNSNTALLIEGYASTILNDFALAWTGSHGEPAPPAVLDVRTRYNPTLVSRWFIVPGIVALLDPGGDAPGRRALGRARARDGDLRPVARHPAPADRHFAGQGPARPSDRRS